MRPLALLCAVLLAAAAAGAPHADDLARPKRLTLNPPSSALLPPPPSPPRKPSKPGSGDDEQGTALSITFVCVLLLGGVLLRQFMEKRKLPAITETGACMLLGALVNGAFWSFARLVRGRADSRLSISMSDDMHDIIYFGLLPPIIFEAGFTMRKRSFFANFSTILLYAVVGTLLSIIVTGFITYALAVGGIVTQSFTFSEVLRASSLLAA